MQRSIIDLIDFFFGSGSGSCGTGAGAGAGAGASLATGGVTGAALVLRVPELERATPTEPERLLLPLAAVIGDFIKYYLNHF